MLPWADLIDLAKLFITGSLRIDLNSFIFDTFFNLPHRINFTSFGYIYLFLVLFVKFILNFNIEYMRNYSCHSSTQAFCLPGEYYIIIR